MIDVKQVFLGNSYIRLTTLIGDVVEWNIARYKTLQINFNEGMIVCPADTRLSLNGVYTADVLIKNDRVFLTLVEN